MDTAIALLEHEILEEFQAIEKKLDNLLSKKVKNKIPKNIVYYIDPKINNYCKQIIDGDVTLTYENLLLFTRSYIIESFKELLENNKQTINYSNSIRVYLTNTFDSIKSIITLIKKHILSNSTL
ncbi:MAG: hypothetical protein QXF12_08245 [Candidatus Aenigmatarchaeota archaeon]